MQCLQVPLRISLCWMNLGQLQLMTAPAEVPVVHLHQQPWYKSLRWRHEISASPRRFILQRVRAMLVPKQLDDVVVVENRHHGALVLRGF